MRNVGLVDPYVSNTRTAASGATDYVLTGALAGNNSAGGVVRGSWVAGGSVAATQNTSATSVLNYAGCLLGQNAGAVSGSSARCAASATGDATNASDYAGGLLGRSQGAVVGSSATGTATADTAAGGLAAELAAGGTVVASYATGAVSATGDGGQAGGLVASMSGASTAVRAGYATGAVSTSGAGVSSNPQQLGGLVGRIDGAGPVIVASYSTGTVTASGSGTGVTNNRGGLVGDLVSGALATQITNSYWDVTTTGIADPPAGQAASPGAGQTTTARCKAPPPTALPPTTSI